jgi:uncharacterized repeat protein (TIGR01451 family)
MRHSRLFHGLIGSALVLAVVLTGLLETEQAVGAANFPPSIPKPIGIVSVHVPAVLSTAVNGRHASSTQTPYLFPALGSCGHFGFCWAPGEPTLAVGPSDIVETVNDQAAVFSKAGRQLADFDFESFWTGGTQVQCGDPRVIYLRPDNRFAISCNDPAANVNRFAISKSGDPTGGWWKYSIGPWVDGDKILATSDKFVLAGNDTTGRTTEDIYVYNKADVLSGLANPKVVHLTTAHSQVYQAVVEQTYTSNGYMVNTTQCPGCVEWLARITGTPAAGNVALREIDLGVTSDAAPLDAAVPGGSINVNGGTYDAVYETETSDNKPVIQYSTADLCGTRDCIVSGRIDLSGPTPVRVYERSIGATGWDYTYGAAGLDAAGHVFEAYSRSNASTTPGAAVVGPGWNVTLQPATAGTTSCSTNQTPPCDERWGDYLGTAIDPSSPSSVWVTGLYQLGSGLFGWGTVIAKVSLLIADMQVSVTGPASITKGGNGTYAVTVTNNGPDTSSAVNLQDTVPTGTTFVSETQTSGPTFNCSNPSAGGTGQTSCTLASMSKATTATFKFVYHLPASSTAPSIMDTARVSSKTDDPITSNNTFIVITPVS